MAYTPTDRTGRKLLKILHRKLEISSALKTGRQCMLKAALKCQPSLREFSKGF